VTLDKLNRRTHLYLGMFLLPWFLMYGVSSIVFSHHDFVGKYFDDGRPEWSKLFEREYRIAIAKGGEGRALGARILRDQGIEWKGSWGTYSPNDREFVVYMFDFWSSERLTYFKSENRILAEERRFRWDHFLAGLHARGEFDQDLLLADAWAVAVDFVMIAILLWITTGLIMFWGVRHARGWGLLALGGGALSMLGFLLAL
jgi:hypothetical protein